MRQLSESFGSLFLYGHNVFQADATKLTELPENPFVMVTETWLGPALTKPLTELERPKVQREIEALYDHFLKNLKSIAQGPITLVLKAPYHREKNARHFLPKLPAILTKHATILPLSEHKRPSLFYERKNQLVSREVWKIRIGG